LTPGFLDLFNLLEIITIDEPKVKQGLRVIEKYNGAAYKCMIKCRIAVLNKPIS